MIFTQLRSFHAVAAEKGFTAASRVLNVGQPTLTSQVPIATTMGERKAGDLRRGDVVRTEHGQTVPVLRTVSRTVPALGIVHVPTMDGGMEIPR